MSIKNPTRSEHSKLLGELKSLIPRCMLQDRVHLEIQLNKLLQSHRGNLKNLKRLKVQAIRSIASLEKRRKNQPSVTYPEDLPLTEKKEEILQAILNHPVVIVSGETGSGKTTQLPKICLEAGRGLTGKIACTQPRRVAALSVSRRIAEELKVTWGKEVGCKIRFKDKTAPETSIKMLTDGMLLAEIQNDPNLYEYDTIIIDEAHERSLNIDFLLGYLRLLLKGRSDLKLIITSATINTEAFSQAFNQAPIIEVSGRLYPVEVCYWPQEEILEKSEDYNYIDAVVTAIDRITSESSTGDLLIFLPTEKDIHETHRRLEGRNYKHTQVLPLFGRLTWADQQRVFSIQGHHRRIVVATNVAETSLTIPGIRYVIDTGLARISRYNPRNQTHRLPIEPISRSSVQQRSGRCGRVSGGICIRLYSESDFLSRPLYTQPEIQRANLAEVILRMLALHLGNVETFPFLDPPKPQAVQGGFLLLQELGALDGKKCLNAMGRDMARLPIAPTLARMVLQAQKEGAVREVLVIAAAISIQDPRLRPIELKEQADQEHKKFIHPESDFLTYLNIWNAYHNKLEGIKSQSGMRRFCKRHYLSYNRMREWNDIYLQLRQTLREIGGFQPKRDRADYDAIHRSILSGLLSNIAQKKEQNLYRGTRGRDIMLFPGSGLFQRKISGSNSMKSQSPKTHTPNWIVAAEIVETSRIFARNAARIIPNWLIELGKHLTQASFLNPHWNARSGRVLATETLTLYGLQISQTRIPFRRINPVEATEIFIREALVNNSIQSTHPFLEHNRQMRQRVESWQMRGRCDYGIDLDQAVYNFYAQRLKDISSVHDLNRIGREKSQKNSNFFFMEESDLVGEQIVSYDPQVFPEHLVVEGEKIPLSYTYRPGEHDDGITIKMPYKMIHFVSPDILEWLVPGLLHEKITNLLRGLPKGIRKQFVPIPDFAREIVNKLQPTHSSLLESLETFLLSTYGVKVHPSDWHTDTLPDHLKMRVEVQGAKKETLLSGRNFNDLIDRLDRQDSPLESEAWVKATKTWRRDGLKSWTFGDLPKRIEITRINGVPVFGYPGLKPKGDSVCIRLFRDLKKAEQESYIGLIHLYQLELKNELRALKQDLKDLKNLQISYGFKTDGVPLHQSAYKNLLKYLFFREDLHPLTEDRFKLGLEEARQRLQGLLPKFLEQMGDLMEICQKIRLLSYTYSDLEKDLTRLLPANFMNFFPFKRLSHLPRYLKSIYLRAERARLDPAKDRQKADQINPFQDALENLIEQHTSSTSPHQIQIEEFRWMVEEFRVSIFAQELGTAHPISAKRLTEKLKEIQKLIGNS